MDHPVKIDWDHLRFLSYWNPETGPYHVLKCVPWRYDFYKRLRSVQDEYDIDDLHLAVCRHPIGVSIVNACYSRVTYHKWTVEPEVTEI